VAQHTIVDGVSLCGQATSPGRGEPCRSCVRVAARREREATEAAARREWFARFQPGVFVWVDSSRNARVAGVYVVGEVWPERESMDLIARTGREMGARRLTGGSFEVYHRAGGSQSCHVDVLQGCSRDPIEILAALRKARKKSIYTRGSSGRIRFLWAELMASGFVAWIRVTWRDADGEPTTEATWKCSHCGAHTPGEEPRASCPDCGRPTVGLLR